MIFQECSQIFEAGAKDHLMNLFNLLDLLLLTVYSSVFTIRFWTMIKVRWGPFSGSQISWLDMGRGVDQIWVMIRIKLGSRS